MVEISIFISSKMQELKAERELIKDFLPSLNQGMVTIKPWLFEYDAPASESPIREVYLQDLQTSMLYVGIFWNDYGEWTIDEFDKAGEWNIPRHIYVKDVEANKRDPKLRDFLAKHGDVEGGITAKWFKTDKELKQALENSIGEWLKNSVMYRPGAAQAVLYDDPDDVDYLADAGLFGRGELLTEIQSALNGDNSRVLLQAFSGVGKTALAAQIVYDWIEEKEENILWLRMGASDIEGAFEALSHPFGASKQMASTPIENKPKMLRDLIKSQNIGLIVLDDCWNGQSLLAIQKGIPRNVPLLVTTRQRYPLTPIFAIPDLPKDEALALLHKLAPELIQDEDAGKALCEKLYYHAFALEVAGRTMQAKSYTAKKLLEDIEATDITQLKVPLEYQQARRENIASLIETTLKELSKEAKDIFLAWGAFWSPQITPELMGFYFHRKGARGRHRTRIEKAMNELHQYGLSRYTSSSEFDRYRLHDLAYEYTKWQNDDEQRNHAVTACLGYIKRYREPLPENFALLEPELDNFLEASTFAILQERYTDVERFARYLYAEGTPQMLVYLGYYSLSIQLLEQAVEAAGRQDNQYEQSVQLGNLGSALIGLREYEQALIIYNQALKTIGKPKDKVSQYQYGVCVGGIGTIHAQMKNYEQAIEYYGRALDSVRRVGIVEDAAVWIGNIGNIHALSGNYERAIKCFENALEISENANNLMRKAEQLGNLGYVYDELGNANDELDKYQKAIEYYMQALSIFRKIGDQVREANTLNNLAMTLESLEKFDEAILYYKQALALRYKSGVSYSIEQTQSNLERTRLMKTTSASGG